MPPGFEDIIERAVAIRRELHRHPERTWKEIETTGRIRRELERLGLAWRPCTDTGTLVDLGDGEAPRIALRADIDALPLNERTDAEHQSQHEGVMHACGHDGHTASLLATAAWLKAHEASLKNPVRLIFQPAEEGGHGAKALIEAGCLEGVGSIFGYHNLPTMPLGRAAAPEGTVLVSNGYFRIVIRGVGGHASTPEACRDPIVAGAQFVSLVQQIVSRNVAPQKAAVVTVATFSSGTTHNIIPQTAELTGTIRAAETSLRDDLAKRVEEVLRGVCTAAGVEADFEFSPAYQATVNHPGEAEHFRKALAHELGADFQWSEGVPFMGAEDFSYYLAEVPGAYALIGTGRGVNDPPLHSPHFDFNDDIIALMVRVYSRIVGAPHPPFPRAFPQRGA